MSATALISVMHVKFQSLQSYTILFCALPEVSIFFHSKINNVYSLATIANRMNRIGQRTNGPVNAHMISWPYVISPNMTLS